MRILVIEDNHRLNNSLQMNLSHEGYSVDVAYDGQEGQDLAELAPYDLIILDILLPKKDGLEVCRELRRRRIHTPILLLTARDSVDDRIMGLDCGADDYLSARGLKSRDGQRGARRYRAWPGYRAVDHPVPWRRSTGREQGWCRFSLRGAAAIAKAEDHKLMLKKASTYMTAHASDSI